MDNSDSEFKSGNTNEGNLTDEANGNSPCSDTCIFSLFGNFVQGPLSSVIRFFKECLCSFLRYVPVLPVSVLRIGIFFF